MIQIMKHIHTTKRHLLAFFCWGCLFLPISAPQLQAQKQELGMHLGATTYKGDLNPSGLQFDRAKPSGGLFYRYLLNEAITLRANLLGGAINGSDQEAPDILGQKRNLEFNVTYGELSLVLEYYILNAKGGVYGRRIPVPYFFAGLGGFIFSGYENSAAEYSTLQPVIPFGLGLKIPLGQITSLDLNLGLRKTFFDYIDNTSAETFQEKNFTYGDQYSTDWYHYLSVSFSYFIQSLSCPFPLPKEEAHSY